MVLYDLVLGRLSQSVSPHYGRTKPLTTSRSFHIRAFPPTVLTLQYSSRSDFNHPPVSLTTRGQLRARRCVPATGEAGPVPCNRTTVTRFLRRNPILLPGTSFRVYPWSKALAIRLHPLMASSGALRGGLAADANFTTSCDTGDNRWSCRSVAPDPIASGQRTFSAPPAHTQTLPHRESLATRIT